MAGTELKHVLDGYKVLDFTQVLAGPTVTRLMAEMGAEIIKDAPFLGEHNEEILCNYLSYTPRQVRELASQGILRKA